MISEDKVVEHATRVFNVIEEKDINVTFFEIVTMIAFLEFQEKEIEFAVLECGLGGRLDATNIVERVACTAITSIGLDHQEILGNTLDEIAAEKAGIVKANINGCVLGPTACNFPIFKDKYRAAVGAPPANLLFVNNNSGID